MRTDRLLLLAVELALVALVAYGLAHVLGGLLDGIGGAL